ncbi:hypothetical protein D3C79_1031010 [compost metagenome]
MVAGAYCAAVRANEKGSLRAALLLLADDDHAAAGVARRIDAEQVVTGFFIAIARTCDDAVSAGAAGARGFAVAVIP